MELQYQEVHKNGQLMNTGYFHGYKGYRFFKNTQNSLPFEL